jgi:hypothetical protein
MWKLLGVGLESDLEPKTVEEERFQPIESDQLYCCRSSVRGQVSKRKKGCLQKGREQRPDKASNYFDTPTACGAETFTKFTGQLPDILGA